MKPTTIALSYAGFCMSGASFATGTEDGSHAGRRSREVATMTTQQERPLSSEENKAIARRLMEEYFTKGDEAIWDELAQPDVVVHGVTGDLRGAAEAKAFYARLRAVFPDLGATIDDIFGEGDKVALRITETGTMRGSFMGMEPTGKSFTLAAIQVCRFSGGKLAELWGARDTGSQLRQLGIAPPSAPPQ